MASGSGGLAVPDDAQLKPFLASAVFVVPWISWQAWVLGSSFRQRRGELVREPKTKKKPSADNADTTAPSSAATSSPPDRLQDRWRPAIFVIGVTSLFLAAQAWLSRVLTTVPEPYLDEIFHIPQAQRYCEGKWLEWDDKITTPPGLYLFSYLYKDLWSGIQQGCSVWGLRAANTIAIMLVAVVACSCRAEIEHQAQYHLQAALDKKEADEETGVAAGREAGREATAASVLHLPPRKLADNIFSLSAFHTGLNIALFPVLFFFSALYYTDVYSTLVTLVAYRNHLFRRDYRQTSNGRRAVPPLWSSALTVVLGLLTLLMRQTNIFWVVVYMGGLEAVEAVKKKEVRPRQNQQTEKETVLAMLRRYVWQYALGGIHDPPVGQSWPDDWVLSLLSIAIAGVCSPVAVLLYVWPYVLVLASFAAFVAWNGGVVLGDKSNHVATLHLAQMLYIWPLFAFFSAPLFVSHGVHFLQRGVSLLVAGRKANQHKQGTAAAGTADADADAASRLEPGPAARLLQISFIQKAYYPLYLLVLGLVVPLGIVHCNTIIHPFTLADNRHYMFYVFRYTIRRAGWIRYALVPVYAACAWACWRVLWGRQSRVTPGQAFFIQSPFAATPREDGAALPVSGKDDVSTPEYGNKKKSKQKNKERLPKPQNAAPAKAKAKSQTTKGDKKKMQANTNACAAAANQGTEAEQQDGGIAATPLKNAVFLSFLDEEPAAAAAQTEPLTSAALLWLLATGLSLVTAPLVEPRYFILPWVFWRLLVPAVPAVSFPETESSEEGSPPGRSILVAIGQKVDIRLFLETAWYGAVLLVTMYVFLYRPYEWRAEDGSVLDEGRLQRFMW